MSEEQVVVPEVKQEPVKPAEQDLVTRVSQVRTEQEVKQELDEKFNINDLDSHIEKIPDQALKEQVLGLKKSLLKGENQKYQEIANLRKQYEGELSKVSTWTPERLQNELKRPDFVQAAQSIMNQPQGQDNTSMLSDNERRMIEQNNNQINQIMRQNQELLKSQQDTQLRQRYANYKPEVVDKTWEELATGKVQAGREHLWKVIDYDNAVQRAYELGRQDKNQQNQERVSGMTFDTGRNITQPSSLDRQKGESTQQFMQRSYQEHTKKK
jgi:hypothetical protein